MFFLPAEELCFKINAFGRTFHRGKSIGKDTTENTELLLSHVFKGNTNKEPMIGSQTAISLVLVLTRPCPQGELVPRGLLLLYIMIFI